MASKMIGQGEDFLFGYTRGKETVMIQNNAEQISAYIMTDLYADKMITNFLDMTEVEVQGGFIFYCRDQEFLRTELIPTLAPMQMGKVEPPEFIPLEEDEEE